MDGDKTNSDLLQEEHTNKQARIQKLIQLTKDIEAFAGQETNAVRDNLTTGLSYLEEAIWLLEDDL
jgi:hypothetical protein